MVVDFRSMSRVNWIPDFVSHSLSRSLFHIVYSTKHRRNFIPRSSLDSTCAYIAGIARNHRMGVFAVGGTQNHVHALVALPPDLALADAVRTLKCNSSRRLRDWVRLFETAARVRSIQREPVTGSAGRELHLIALYSFEEEFRAMQKAAGICAALKGLRFCKWHPNPALPRRAGIVSDHSAARGSMAQQRKAGPSLRSG
jgi:REP element-mobilizing transposase RayT